MSISTLRTPVLLLCVLIPSIAIFSPSAHATQESAVIHSERITLVYPTILSPETAALLLENRLRALTFAESKLDSTVDNSITITIRASLFGGGADSSILFDLPFWLLERFEASGCVPTTALGCHEETHVVANADLGIAACIAMKEGLAVFVDGRYRRGRDYHLATLGLMARGELPPLGRLLDRVWAPRMTTTDFMVIYNGGASLVAFLVELRGMNALRELYRLTWLPSSHIAEDVLRLYGCSLSELEAAWYEHVKDETNGRAHAAQLCVDAVVTQSSLYALMTSIEEMRVRTPAAVGRSAVCEKTLDVLRSHLTALHGAPDDIAAESAYIRHRAAVKCSERMLSTWFRAANAYVAAFGLEAGSAELLRLLAEAKVGYTTVGDLFMADKCATWLAELRGEPSD